MLAALQTRDGNLRRRTQCIVSCQRSQDNHEELNVVGKGSVNPTLLIPGSGLGSPRELLADESAALHDGDSFSLIASRPDLAIIVSTGADPSPRISQQGPPIPSQQPPAGAPPASREAGRPSAAAPGPPGGLGSLHPALPREGCAAGMEAPSGSPGTLTWNGGSPVAAGLEKQPERPERPQGPAGSPPAEHSPDAHAPCGREDSLDGSYRTVDSQSGGSGSEGGAADSGGGAPSQDQQPPRQVQGGEGAGGGRAGRGPKPRAARGVGNGKPPARGAPPVVLVLAGLPGSGKSTVGRALLEASPVAWVHINQDAIRDGKPGKREQCLAAARAALAEGASCVIDRCHADAAQRAHFVALARERQLAVHCVALCGPPPLCAARVAARTDHPGGVQGDGMKRVVYQMARQQQDGKAWPPSSAEGFASVMDCHSDQDAAAAVRAWSLYGRSGADADGGGAELAGAGEAGATHGSAGSVGAGAAAPTPLAGNAERAAAETLAAWQQHAARRKPAPAGIQAFFKPAAGAAAKAGAAGAAAEPRAGGAPAGGAAKRPAVASPAQERGAKRGAAKAAGPAGGASAAGAGAAQAQAGGGGGVQAAPPGRGSAAAGAASPARPAAASTPGRPAAGPGRSGDGAGAGAAAVKEGAAAAGSGSGPKTNAFAVLMASSARGAAAGGGRAGGSPAGAGASGGGGKGAGTPGSRAADDPRFKLSAPWQQPLRKVALDPDTSQQVVLHKDDQVVMIKDGFPKARCHALVIARDPALRSIADLRRQHIPLLAHMREVAEDWVRQQRKQDPSLVPFKLGFHAVPSMAQLHMHVISQDFDSPSLKNKKHWNSFTSSFFLRLQDVESQLATKGRMDLVSKDDEHRLESQELICHGCHKKMKTIPDLKAHIVTCAQVMSLSGI